MESSKIAHVHWEQHVNKTHTKKNQQQPKTISQHTIASERPNRNLFLVLALFFYRISITFEPKRIASNLRRHTFDERECLKSITCAWFWSKFAYKLVLRFGIFNNSLVVFLFCCVCFSFFSYAFQSFANNIVFVHNITCSSNPRNVYPKNKLAQSK